MRVVIQQCTGFVRTAGSYLVFVIRLGSDRDRISGCWCSDLGKVGEVILFDLFRREKES